MENRKNCPNCNSETMKTGKLHGVATLQSLNSRTGVGGSGLLFTFCAACGTVVKITVEEPSKIK